MAEMLMLSSDIGMFFRNRLMLWKETRIFYMRKWCQQKGLYWFCI